MSIHTPSLPFRFSFQTRRGTQHAFLSRFVFPGVPSERTKGRVRSGRFPVSNPNGIPFRKGDEGGIDREGNPRGRIASSRSIARRTCLRAWDPGHGRHQWRGSMVDGSGQSFRWDRDDETRAKDHAKGGRADRRAWIQGMILASEVGDKTFLMAAVMAMRQPRTQVRRWKTHEEENRNETDADGCPCHRCSSDASAHSPA